MDKQAILEQIDRALERWRAARARSQYDDLSDLHAEAVGVITVAAATIRRVAPPGSQYLSTAERGLELTSQEYQLEALVGVLFALRDDYDAGYLSSVHELIHADLFADFLEMAEHLLAEGYKDPAAVLVGAVLEEHLRKLCEKNALTTEVAGKPKKADILNADLTRAGTYTKLDQKGVTAWLDLRNKAAHGQFGDYAKEQVALMSQGVRDFITRNPA